MSNIVYSIIFLFLMTSFVSATTFGQQQMKESLKPIAKNEHVIVDPTDDEINEYDEAISDQVEMSRTFSMCTFLQNMGIEILLGYLAIKRNMFYYFTLLKQHLWQVGVNIIKSKG